MRQTPIFAQYRVDERIRYLGNIRKGKDCHKKHAVPNDGQCSSSVHFIPVYSLDLGTADKSGQYRTLTNVTFT